MLDKGIDVFKADKETIDLQKLSKYIKLITKATFKQKGKYTYYKALFRECKDEDFTENHLEADVNGYQNRFCPDV